MKDIKNESKICCQKNIHQFISNKKKEIISFQFEQVDVLSTLNILEIHSFDFFQGLDNPKTTKKNEFPRGNFQ